MSAVPLVNGNTARAEILRTRRMRLANAMDDVHYGYMRKSC
jgi:hypothetical protein